jgi:hypothetical protein
MADTDTQVLIRIGPFHGLDSRSASVYVEPGDGTAMSNADTHRNSGALSNFYGRAAFANYPVLGPGTVINNNGLARYDVSDVKAYYIAQSGPDGTAATAAWDTISQSAATLPMPNTYTQAIQSNANIFFNNGLQVFYGADDQLHVAQWQYPAPTEAQFGYAVNLNTTGVPLPAATYTYAFVQVIELPTFDGTTNQITDPLGAEPPYPYQVTVNGTTQNVIITGTFVGTTAEGYRFTTQIYRMSSLTNTWYLLINRQTNNPVIDETPDQGISGKQQLVLNYDQPPTGVSDPSNFANRNPIESFQNRMWVLAQVPNSETGGGVQTQLWYTNEGQPWAFNAVDQVLLVGTENTTMRPIANFPIPFGDISAGLAKMGSYLMVFKTSSTWLITGVDEETYTPLPLFADIGLIAPSSLTKAAGRVFWLSAQGAYSYDGANLEYISDKLYNALQAIPPNYLANAIGFYADLTWFLSFPDEGYTYAYYLPKKEWTTLPYATQAAVFDTSIGSGPTAATSYKLNQIAAARIGTNDVDLWLEGQENDLGVGTQVTWTSPITDSGQPYAQKDYRYICVSAPAQPVTVTVALYVDPGFPTTVPTFTAGPLDLSGLPGSFNVPIPQASCVGYTAQVVITAATATGATQPLTIWSVSVGGTMKRMWSQPSGPI